MKRILLLIPVFFIVSTGFSQTPQFRSNLYIIDANGQSVLMDGTLSMYHEDFNDAVDYQDARKMFNPSENIGMMREDKVLIVERRNEIQNRADTIHYKFWNSRIITYRLELTSRYFDNQGMTAVLYDRYLNKEVNLSFLQNNHYDFSVTLDVNSRRPDRFMVVFNPEYTVAMGVMPLNFMDAFVTKDDNGIKVSWTTANETNVKDFVVERSSNGIHFETTGHPVSAQNLLKNHYSFSDKLFNANINYYRIRATDLDGRISYSKVIRMNTSQLLSAISLYPNPTTSSAVYLQLSGLAQGQYKITIVNNFGSIVHWQSESLSASASGVRLHIQRPLASGVYRVVVSGAEAYSSTHTLVIR